jgi:hypothetical protein
MPGAEFAPDTGEVPTIPVVVIKAAQVQDNAIKAG